jgi:hypothetical protein
VLSAEGFPSRTDLLVAGYVPLPLAEQIVLQPKEDVLLGALLPSREREEQGQDPSHSIINVMFAYETCKNFGTHKLLQSFTHLKE